jgi:hypothetical protein
MSLHHAASSRSVMSSSPLVRLVARGSRPSRAVAGSGSSTSPGRHHRHRGWPRCRPRGARRGPPARVAPTTAAPPGPRGGRAIAPAGGRSRSAGRWDSAAGCRGRRGDALPRPAAPGRPAVGTDLDLDAEGLQEPPRRGGHLLDRLVEGGGVALGRSADRADLANVLAGGGLELAGGGGGVRTTERLDAATHGRTVRHGRTGTPSATGSRSRRPLGIRRRIG